MNSGVKQQNAMHECYYYFLKNKKEKKMLIENIGIFPHKCLNFSKFESIHIEIIQK